MDCTCASKSCCSSSDSKACSCLLRRRKGRLSSGMVLGKGGGGFEHTNTHGACPRVHVRIHARVLRRLALRGERMHDHSCPLAEAHTPSLLSSGYQEAKTRKALHLVLAHAALSQASLRAACRLRRSCLCAGLVACTPPRPSAQACSEAAHLAHARACSSTSCDRLAQRTGPHRARPERSVQPSCPQKISACRSSACAPPEGPAR